MTAFPCENFSPTDYGWAVEDNALVPVWFEGPAIPVKAGQSTGEEDDLEKNDNEDEPEDLMNDSDEEAWSEDSDSASDK